MAFDCRYLFVYGTLRRSSRHRMARFLAEQARFAGEARIPGRLYDLGRYPGMLPARGADDWVHGDLYELPDDQATLDALDQYESDESPQPSFFDRQLAEVTDVGGGTITAWVYWFRGEVEESRWIASGRYQP
jgi:gamma-glutamylcyclotransferase (GGCT)/AIG2-like uncharacterized protein YtfP